MRQHKHVSILASAIRSSFEMQFMSQPDERRSSTLTGSKCGSARAVTGGFKAPVGFGIEVEGRFQGNDAVH